MRLVLSAAFLLLLFVSPAHGAPGWLAPQDLSAPGQHADRADLAIDPSGNTIAVWERFDGSDFIIQMAVRPVGGTWLPAQDLSAAGESAFFAQVAVDPMGNAIAVWRRSNGTNNVIQSAFRPAGGAWQLPAQDLSALGENAGGPQIAVDSTGNAIAVWERFDGSNFRVQGAFRPAGGSWQLPAQDLSSAGFAASAFDPQVAFDQAGKAIAIWRRFNGAGDHIIQVSFRPAGGSWQLPAQDLSAAGGTSGQQQIALNPAGDAVAVWRRWNGMHDIIQAAVRPAGGPWQLPAVDLSAAGQHASTPQVAVDSNGNAIAVWHRSDGANTIVQTAARPAGGPWGAVENLSAPGVSASDARVGFDQVGRAIAVWQRSVMQSAIRPPGGTWQPAGDLSAAGATRPALAVDSAGNAVAAWYRSNGANDIIQAAVYDATAPVVRAVNGPGRAFARQRLTFSLDAFDAWSALAPPVWSFGDGKTASGQTVTHTFARGGTYTVGVTQPDAVGNASSATRLLTLRVARCFRRAATRVGTSGPDRIRGTRRADVIVTLGGADRVRGRGGKDRICGGKGRDRLAGGAGNDLLNGGPGKDICSQGGGRGRLVAC